MVSIGTTRYGQPYVRYGKKGNFQDRVTDLTAVLGYQLVVRFGGSGGKIIGMVCSGMPKDWKNR